MKNLREQVSLFRIVLAAAVFIASANVYAFAADESGMQAWINLISNNKADISASSDSSLLRLEAAYCAARMRADYPAAFNFAVLALEKKKGHTPLHLQRAIKAAQAAGKNSELAEALRELYRADQAGHKLEQAQREGRFNELFTYNKLMPVLIPLMQDELLRLALKYRDLETAEMIASEDGWIRTWARVAGPFTDDKPWQPERPHTFDATPDANEYVDGRGSEVTILEDVTSSRPGELPIYALLPQGRSGAAYAVALLEVEKDCQAVLEFNSNPNIRAWLNGLPCYRGDLYRGYRPARYLRRVQLHAGINWLVLRTHSRTKSGVQVLDPYLGVMKDIKVLKWSERHGKAPALRELPGMLASLPEAERFSRSAELPDIAPMVERLYSDINSTPTPEEVTEIEMLAEDGGNISHLLALAEEAEYVGAVPLARAVREVLERSWSESRFILAEGGIFRFREADMSIDSAERLRKEGVSLLRQVLEMDGTDARAHYMLAIYHREHKEMEEALDAFGRAVDSNSSFAMARRDYASLLDERELGVPAEEEYRTAMALWPEGAPLARFLKKQKRLEESRELMDIAWKKGELSVYQYVNELEERGAWDKVSQVIAEHQKIFPYNKRTVLAWQLSGAREQGELEKAYGICQQLAEHDPSVATYCKEAMETALRLGRNDDARNWGSEALRRITANGGADLKLRRRLRNLAGNDWQLGQYDLKLADIDASPYVADNFPQANYAEILRLEVHRIYPDRSVESLVHRAVRLFDKQGIDSLSELSLPGDSDDILAIRTIQADGTVHYPTNIKRLDFSRAASMYRVVPGATLEYSFRRTRYGGERSSFDNNFFFQEFNVPVGRGRYVLIIPREFAEGLSVKAMPRNLALVITDNKADDTLVYTWDITAMEPVQPEKMMPSRDEILANITVQLHPFDYGSQRQRFGLPELTHDDAGIVTLARQITAGLDSPEAKIDAIYAWMGAHLEPGGSARTPRDAVALGAASAGVAQELMQAMLAAIGLEVYVGQANVYLDRHMSKPEDRAEMLGNFSQPLLRVAQEDGKYSWLRFFSPMRHYRSRDLGGNVSGSPVLLKGWGGLVMLDWVRAEELEKQSYNYDTHLLLKPDGSAVVEGRVRFLATAAAALRQIAEQPQDGPRRIERFATGLYPKIMITDSSYPAPEETREKAPARGSENFDYTFTGTVGQFCRREGSSLAFNPWPYPMSAFKTILGAKERTLPFSLNGDVQAVQHVRYSAPEGWSFGEVPWSLWLQGDYGLYVTSFVVSGGELEVSRFLVIPAREFSVEDYVVLARWIEACEATERNDVRLMSHEALGLSEVLAPVMENRYAELHDRCNYWRRWWPVTEPEVETDNKAEDINE